MIATEVKDDPGSSVTNVAEHLASHVCDRFGIDPDRLARALRGAGVAGEERGGLGGVRAGDSELTPYAKSGSLAGPLFFLGN